MYFSSIFHGLYSRYHTTTPLMSQRGVEMALDSRRSSAVNGVILADQIGVLTSNQKDICCAI